MPPSRSVRAEAPTVVLECRPERKPARALLEQRDRPLEILEPVFDQSADLRLDRRDRRDAWVQLGPPSNRGEGPDVPDRCRPRTWRSEPGGPRRSRRPGTAAGSSRPSSTSGAVDQRRADAGSPCAAAYSASTHAACRRTAGVPLSSTTCAASVNRRTCRAIPGMKRQPGQGRNTGGVEDGHRVAPVLVGEPGAQASSAPPPADPTGTAGGPARSRTSGRPSPGGRASLPRSLRRRHRTHPCRRPGR